MTEPYLDDARDRSRSKLSELQEALSGAEKIVADKACVYATGSFGRFEAGPTSDLDLFIVVDVEDDAADRPRSPLLNGLDEIRLKYHLITAVEELGLPEFDGDGKYLKIHTVDDYVIKLGSPQDDYENTLTGRLLMLLESKPLLGLGFYWQAMDEVIAAYFVDYSDNRDDFVPAFMLNDIMRMWRTFCVNYEYYRTKGSLKSKIKNLKLKYSRMLTCYSAVIYLLAVFSKKGTVAPEDVKDMARITPTERLETVADYSFWGVAEQPDKLEQTAAEALKLYSEFLDFVHKPKQELEQEYTLHQSEWRVRSHEFGEKLAKMIEAVAHATGEPSRLYRYVLI